MGDGWLEIVGKLEGLKVRNPATTAKDRNAIRIRLSLIEPVAAGGFLTAQGVEGFLAQAQGLAE